MYTHHTQYAENIMLEHIRGKRMEVSKKNKTWKLKDKGRGREREYERTTNGKKA